MQTNSSNLLVLLAFALALIALGLSIYLFWALKKLNELRLRFFSGSEGQNLEAAIETLLQNQTNLAERQGEQGQILAALLENEKLAVQKIGLVRFNPFADGGGNFSFCLALLDRNNSGVVITSMYAREQNRIYGKKIMLGQSDGPLTEEEQLAILQANELTQENLTKPKNNEHINKQERTRNGKNARR